MKELLLLHGALASKSQFDDFGKVLQPSFKSHAINFSGHGGSPIPASGYTFDTFAGDILRHADEAGIDKLDIFGYSMGGYAALYFAHKHPDRINRIFTLNTKFNWDPLSTARETAMLNAEKMMDKVPAFANNLMLQHGMSIWKSVLQSTSDMMHNLASQVMLTDEALSAISCPVLVAVGDRDKTTSIEENLDVYKKLPNAQLLVLPNTPHPFDKADTSLLLHHCKVFFS